MADRVPDRQQEPWTKRMKLDSFNCLLVDISKDITDDNLRQMKDRCDTLLEEKRIGRRQLDKITQPYDLIKELKLRGDIDECNTSVLEYLLQAAGLGTLVKKLREHRLKQLLVTPILAKRYTRNWENVINETAVVKEESRILDCGNRETKRRKSTNTEMKRRDPELTYSGTKLAYDWAMGKYNEYPLAFHVNAKQIGSDQDLMDAVYDQLLPYDIGISKYELLQHIKDRGKPVLYIVDGIDSDGCKLKTGSAIRNAIPSTILPLCEVRATEHNRKDVVTFNKSYEADIITNVIQNYPSQIDEMISVLKNVYLKFKKTFIGSTHAFEWAYNASSEYFLVFHIDTYQMETNEDLVDAAFYQLLPAYKGIKDELLRVIRHQDKPVLFILDGFGEDRSAIQNESDVVGATPWEILHKCKFLSVTSID